MTRPKVFVTRGIPQVGIDKLAAVCDVDVWSGPLPPPREELLKRVAGVDGLLCLLTEAPINAEVIATAGPRLRVISNFAVGVNNIDVAAATAAGVCVGNTPDVLTEASADMALALLIAAARCFTAGADDVRHGRWLTWEPNRYIGLDLLGKTLGIVGLGRIGTALARRCRGGWGMSVIYHNRRPNPQAEAELGATAVSFDELLARSDFVSVHTDLNAATRGLFNAGAFAKMKPTAVFVNTARGPVHVTADLVAALKSGTIFAAGLDVTDPEPPRYGDPTDLNNQLLMLPNVVVQPHTASATVSARNGMAEIAADNILAGLAGKPLRAWVNPEVAGHRR